MAPTPDPRALPAKALSHILATAREAARSVGGYVERSYAPRPSLAQRKGEGDFVTAVDIAAEDRLKRLILREYPDHGFLGEEGGACSIDSEFVWVVDPIDGTSNFAQGLPLFAVSVACLMAGRPIAAAVHCFPERVTYSAAVGRGAFQGRQRLRTPPARLDDAGVIGVQWHRGERELGFVERLVRSGARIRVLGSTVTQLCDVAVGRLHANIQEQGRIWDFAAAGLIAVEAGSEFTDWQGHPIFPVASLSGGIHYPSVAAVPAVHEALLERLAPA